jgi:hypothetical protein
MTGTATAAFRAEEQERLSQDFCDTVTAPEVLLAALDAVPLASDRLELAPAVPVVTEVAKVVGEVFVAEDDAEAPVELAVVPVDVAEVRSLVVAASPAVVWLNSLANEEARLAMTALPGASVGAVKVP